MTETKEVETAQIEEAQNNLNFEKELEKEAKRKCCAFCDSEVSVLEICEDCLMLMIFMTLGKARKIVRTANAKTEVIENGRS